MKVPLFIFPCQKNEMVLPHLNPLLKGEDVFPSPGEEKVGLPERSEVETGMRLKRKELKSKI